MKSSTRTPLIHRIAIGVLFFLLGLCFSSWASRIPTIRQNLVLSDTQLGLVLFALPLGSFLSLTMSGWLINKIGSKKIVLSTLFFYGILLVTIGASKDVFQLICILFAFGWVGNTVNIAVNTQALGVQQLYGRSIMASFHGLWSLAGFTGAAIGSLMIARGISPLTHFSMVAIFILAAILISAPYTLAQDSGQRERQPFFVPPTKALLSLGVIAFCTMICEGAMFDWSGIYFQKVVSVKPSLIGAGYSGFMSTMAAGRFIADRFSHRFGVKFTLQCSGVLIAMGLLTAVVFPFFLSALCGFLLVGFGVCSVVPLVYTLAGKSTVMSSGAALATVSTIGFLGFLLGPPLIGLIAGAFTLRASFLLIALMGLCVTFVSSKVL
ncbi:MAG: MFS transporter [Flavisolibacter sp.]